MLKCCWQFFWGQNESLTWFGLEGWRQPHGPPFRCITSSKTWLTGYIIYLDLPRGAKWFRYRMSINQPIGILGIDRLSPFGGAKIIHHSSPQTENLPKFSPACRAWITCTLASLWFYIAMWRGATSWLAKRGGCCHWGAAANSHCQTSGRLTLPETNGRNLPVEMNVVGIWSFLSFWCQTILRGEVLGSVNVKRIGKTNSGWGRMCFFFRWRWKIRTTIHVLVYRSCFLRFT